VYFGVVPVVAAFLPWRRLGLGDPPEPLAACVFGLRRVVESALRRGAAALVLAHNHPNAHVQPSEQDKVLTRAIVLAAETVSVKIVDHLIVSASESFSFRKAGLP
jgi:DNA repair protein RadC